MRQGSIRINANKWLLVNKNHLMTIHGIEFDITSVMDKILKVLDFTKSLTQLNLTL